MLHSRALLDLTKDQITLPVVLGILADFQVPHEINSWNFQNLLVLGFRETSQNLSSFRKLYIFNISKIRKKKNLPRLYVYIHWFFGFFSKGSPFETLKIKVVWMSSNFERFHEILNQANSENFSCLSHVEPKNLPGCKMIWSLKSVF